MRISDWSSDVCSSDLVQQVGPGDCPKCGMALEPMMPSLDEDDGSELRSMTRRFRILLALTLPVFLLAMGPHLFGWHLPAPWDGVAVWVEAVLASIVVLWGDRKSTRLNSSH